MDPLDCTLDELTSNHRRNNKRRRYNGNNNRGYQNRNRYRQNNNNYNPYLDIDSTETLKEIAQLRNESK